jgi:hypothetical protein
MDVYFADTAAVIWFQGAVTWSKETVGPGPDCHPRDTVVARHRVTVVTAPQQ